MYIKFASKVITYALIIPIRFLNEVFKLIFYALITKGTNNK